MFKKLLLSLALVGTFAYAEMKNEQISPKLVESNITIIDIRTKPEWQQTGIIKNSIPITFFRADGGYDVKDFLSKLDKKISKDKPFALVCRSGNRTSMVSQFLGKNGYNVINLVGGINSLISQGYKLSPYKNNSQKRMKR